MERYKLDSNVYYIVVTMTPTEKTGPATLSAYDDETRTLYLYPGMDKHLGMDVAATLNHEFGHLYEHYLHDKEIGSPSHEYYLSYMKTGNTSDREKFERIIIGKYETPFNIKTGQKIRSVYFKGESGVLPGDTLRIFRKLA